MAHILFATVPIAGHVLPAISIARRLVERGHRVSWYTGSAHTQRVRAAGATYVPYHEAHDFDDARLEQSFPARAQQRGLGQLKFDLKHVFIDQALPQLHDLEAFVRADPAALVIADSLMLGALLLKELHGIPLIAFNVVGCPMRSRDTAPFGLGLFPGRGWLGKLRDRALYALVEQGVFADVQRHWLKTRREVGLPTSRMLFDAALEATWFVQPTVPSLEYPRSDWPANVKLVGALHPELPTLPAHAQLLAELPRPLVHVTQGTTSNASPTLIGPALRALAREPVGVLVATGGRSPALRVPANARVVPYISYPALLPQTAVMLTNGGYGGVQLALSHGVPLVVWGTSEDKPETAARVAWAGAGVRLRRPRPVEIRDAVREVLHEPRYRQRAAELAREYARYDAVGAVVELSEQTLALPR